MAKILVVDDEEPLRELLARVLQQEGHEVVTADNGRRALEIFNQVQDEGQGPFNAIVTDMNMPEMDGATLACTIRGSVNPVPVIIMTGRMNQNFVGAWAVLPKPVNNQQIAGVVKAFL